jgi:hypothetical protein
MLRSVSRAALAAMVALCCGGPGCAAQAGRAYTAADYGQAESFMDYNVQPLVTHSVERPVWLGDGRFWYRDAGPDGVNYVVVDPAKGTKGTAFDQSKVAAGLNAAIKSGKLTLALSTALDAGHLPIDDFVLEDEGRAILLTMERRLERCKLIGKGECKADGDLFGGGAGVNYDVSPDGKKAALSCNSTHAAISAAGPRPGMLRERQVAIDDPHLIFLRWQKLLL